MTLPPDQLRRFVDAVERWFGIRLGDRPTAAADIVSRRAAARRESEAAYVLRIDDADARELRALAAEVSVGETYFFRHVEQFQAFADALPGLIARAGRVSVLSAGCSSGEEPYTLAMLAHERVDVRMVLIEAIDLNPDALARARRGVYTRWAMRATTAEHQARWFEPSTHQLEIAPQIRDAVTFVEGNLIDAAATWTTRTWDVVFCRNVLMYLTEQHARSIVERFARTLAPGGYLFLGHAEMLRDYAALGLELRHTHGTFYYQRASHAGSPPAPRLVTQPSPRLTADDRWFEDIGNASKRVGALADVVIATKAPTRPQDPLAAIRDLVREERFDDARAALAELPAAMAAQPDVVLLRAAIATQTGDTATAEVACSELLADPARRASANYLLAIVADAAGDGARSEARARQALADDPTFAMAEIHLAFVARRHHDRAAVAAHLTRAVALLECESDSRLELIAGGFSRMALLRMCRAELEAMRGPA